MTEPSKLVQKAIGRSNAIWNSIKQWAAAGVTAYSIRVVFDPAGMNSLAYLFRRNESASGFNPPRMNCASGFDPSPRKRSAWWNEPGTNPLAVLIRRKHAVWKHAVQEVWWKESRINPLGRAVSIPRKHAVCESSSRGLVTGPEQIC